MENLPEENPEEILTPSQGLETMKNLLEEKPEEIVTPAQDLETMENLQEENAEEIVAPSQDDNMSHSQDDDHMISCIDKDEDENYNFNSPDQEGYGYSSPNERSYSLFESSYTCRPLSSIPEKDHLEQGDQIIMPQSALCRLLYLRVGFPMLFKIQNSNKERVSHCGVYEFTAEEGSVFLPDWMMKNLQLQQGEIVSLKSVSLEKGTYVKLQPHSVEFLEILNPKAALEESLSSRFFCLTSGDTITINYNCKDYVIDIVEARPSSAVCILDTDCEVDFAPPLDYEEPVKPVKQIKQEEEEKGPSKKLNFAAVTGRARRLDEKPGEELPSHFFQEKMQAIDADTNSVTKSQLRPARRPGIGKLVLGSSDNKSKPKESVTKIDKTETPKAEKFQPFTGKKYTLGG